LEIPGNSEQVGDSAAAESGGESAQRVLTRSAQASRIYFLPNLMTAGNLFCGYVAIIRCVKAWSLRRWGGDGSPEEFYTQAVWFIFAAVVFDSLDGRLARLGGRESLFGREFDSIADIVSFGVAPALLMFYLILSPEMNPHFAPFGWFIGFIYLLCAGVRLARFNVITHPLVYTTQAKYNTKDFVGLPVPAAAGVIVSLVLLINAVEDLKRWVLLLPVLMVLIAFLMVSTIRYPSFKQVDWRTRARFGTFVVFLVLIAFIFFFHQFALVFIFLGYVLFGLGRHIMTVQRRRRLIRDKLAARHTARENAAANKPANSRE
jgi:CDP-diacylglycerol--serine O-phosphatidyltransferase